MRKKKRNPDDIRRLSDELKASIRNARDVFFSTTLTSFMTQHPQKFWRYLSKPADHVTQIDTNGTITDEALTIANTFNRYFQSVFTRTSASAQNKTVLDSALSMSELVITHDGILNLLLQIDVKKRSGPDDLSNAFLRRYAEQITPFLHAIFVSSLQTATLPTDWLRARVLPIHKGGNKLLVTNYRPISLTSSCCKLMEHIVNKAITTYLEDNNLLYSKQHGFRKGLSTITQLLEIAHDFATVINSRLQCDAIFIDFSKAFDKVPHQKLIDKLKIIGIETNIVHWIAAYLSNRSQHVKVNDAESEELDVYSGVPQGSVLGPILFLIFVNDIHCHVEPDVTVRLFADDCVIYTTVRAIDDQLRLNTSLTNISRWCQEWGMEINVGKTSYMHITRKRAPLKFAYHLNGLHVAEAASVKYLGVTITNTLKWDVHINQTCTKAYRQLGYLRRKLALAPSKVRLTSYKCLVRPILEYGSVIWNPHQTYLLNQLEGIQNKALRFVYSQYSRDVNITALRNRASIQTLAIRRRIAALKFLYLLYHDNININKHEYLKPPYQRSARTNHDKSIRPFISRCNSFKYSYFPSVIEIWNNLPRDIVSSESLESFTANLEKFLDQ